MKKETAKAYAMLIGAMLIFGTIGIFRRNIPLSSPMLAFARGGVGGIFLLLLTLLRRKSFTVSGKDLALLVLSGALMGVNWILLFEAYNFTTVGKATLCYYMAPTVVILLSPLLLKERLTLRRLICAAVSVLGMIPVSGVLEESTGSAGDTAGILLGLGAAVLYASVVLLNKKITAEDAYGRTVVQLLSAALVLVPYLLFTEGFSSLRLEGSDLWLTLTVCIVHTGIAYALYFGSIRALPAQSVAVLSYVDPVSALLLSALLLREPLTPLGILGAVLILGAAVVGSLEKTSEEKA